MLKLIFPYTSIKDGVVDTADRAHLVRAHEQRIREVLKDPGTARESEGKWPMAWLAGRCQETFPSIVCLDLTTHIRNGKIALAAEPRKIAVCAR